MDSVKFFLQTQLPTYLKNLPIPNTVGGFAQLSGEEWSRLLPLIGFLVMLMYLLISSILELGGSKAGTQPEKAGSESSRINQTIDLEKDKVATAVDMEDIGDKAAYCRCWRSKKFPLCDGSHNGHNKETGDNVGPLIVKRQQPESEKKAQ